MDLKSQRRMASEVLGCGENRVWIDPDAQDEVADAITKADIRRLVQEGDIKEKGAGGQSRGRAKKINSQKEKGRRKGHGSRKGKEGSRQTEKEKWVSNIRAQRKLLKKLKDTDRIDPATYQNLYKKAKGGFFHSKKHMKKYIQNNVLEGEEVD